MTDFTLERIKLTVDYELGYQSEKGRADALKGAEEGAIKLCGAGPGGSYSAERLGSWIAAREMDTAEIIAAVHARADALEGDDLAQFGRGLLYTAASIVGQAEGGYALSDATAEIAWKALDAADEGLSDG
jgi:hypothetical protein